MIKHCKICNKPFKVKPCEIDKKLFCSLPCYYEARRQGLYKHTGFQKGHGCFTTPEGRKRQSQKTSNENHWAWRGNKANIKSIHSWIRRIKGKPTYCQKCNATSKERVLDWCNINHKYNRDINDFISMCRSCHRKFDIKYNDYFKERKNN